MKVLVIGGATIDVITSIDPENIECITMSNATNSYLMMEQGKKVEASRIDTQIGGGATNASVAMSRMGADVSCVLKLGDDIDAERVLSRLQDEGHDRRHRSRVKDRSHPQPARRSGACGRRPNLRPAPRRL